MTEVSNDIGEKAIQKSYSGSPIYVTEAQPGFPWNNDLNWKACHFSDVVNNNRTMNDTTYQEHLYLRDLLRDDYAVEFDLTEEQT